MIPSWFRNNVREIRRVLGVAALAAIFLAAPAMAQCPGGCGCNFDAHVIKIGVGCGAGPVPTLNSTPPILGSTMILYATSGVPNGLTYIFSSSPPPQPLTLPSGCLIYLNLADVMTSGPFQTNAAGAFTFEFNSPAGAALCGLTCNIQMAIYTSGGAQPGFQFTNAIQATMGCDAGGNDNGIPDNKYCTYSKSSYSGSGAGSGILNNHYVGVFPQGLEIGDYDTSNGNSAPNGLLWQSSSTGKNNLKTFLSGGSSTGTAFTSDASNPTSGNGGGILARETAALALNVAFNDAGFAGSIWSGFGNLIFIQSGKSLSGLSVRQIITVADAALAGSPLPAGYSFSSLQSLVADLNLSFCGCDQSNWSQSHIFKP
jgi:hypothetical protein